MAEEQVLVDGKAVDHDNPVPAADLSVRDLLHLLLAEQRKTNVYLAELVEDTVHDDDVEDP